MTVSPEGNPPEPQVLEAQALEFDAGGLPFSTRYGDRYASAGGAIEQARHVFLAGNDLPRRWAGRRQFVIVETGFGLGNNFLATWQAWRADPDRPTRLHFVSLERHPLRAEDLCPARAAGADRPEPELLQMRAALAASWPLPLAGIHRIEFDGASVVLSLVLGDARRTVSQLRVGADAFYLDGFAPDRNPELWEPGFLAALARHARVDATAATYTCARAVRDGLAAAGFEVERRGGFGAKREMLAARYAPRWRMRRHDPPAAWPGEQHAIVVGAGLAGCGCARSLQRRGWRVTLLDRAGDAAGAASGLPAGLLHPLLSIDDNLASRLSRAGFLFALRLLGALPAAQVKSIWRPCGVFQPADTTGDEEPLRALLDRWSWPAEYARYRSAGEVAPDLGIAPLRGGAWFAMGGVVAAGQWCRAMIGTDSDTRDADVPAPLQRVFSFDAASIEWHDGLWRVTGTEGSVHAAPVLILANAFGIDRLQPQSHASLHEIGGRMSLLRAPALARLRAGISGDGYLVPPLLGRAAAGATYEWQESGDAQPGGFDDADAHARNLERIGNMLEAGQEAPPDGIFAARRCVSGDRMPLAGAIVDEEAVEERAAGLAGAHLPELPRRTGLYCLTALGSRGLCLAPLLGEHIASLVAGEPEPLEPSLAAAVDPGRFALRALRRTRILY